MPSEAESRTWVAPKFDEQGMTRWFWRVLHHENLKLGNNVQIGSFTVIDAMNGVDIEDNVQIGFGCVILSHSSIDGKSGGVTLKNNCRIGSNTVIMPNVTVGENAIIGANSFIGRNIPADEVWVGSPVKYLKKVKVHSDKK